MGWVVTQGTIQTKIEELEREAMALDMQARTAGGKDSGHEQSDLASAKRYAADVLRNLKGSSSAWG